MKLGDKIQYLRKQQGMSQEQLAEQLGISRQSVSKWEAEQSQPELDKILQLAAFFDVTTDALLKDEVDITTPSPKTLEELRMPSAVQDNSLYPVKIQERVVPILSTFFCAIGLIAAIVLWRQWQTDICIGIGVAVQIFGCALFEMAISILAPREECTTLRKKFYRINVWLLLVIPISVLAFGLSWLIPRPYPYWLPWVFGFSIYGAIGWFVVRALKRGE